MKDTLSRILAVLGVVVAIGTLAALVAVWGMLNDRVDGLATTVMSQGERIEGLEQAGDEMEEESEPLGLDARPVMPEEYFGELPPNLEQATTEVEYRNGDIGLAFRVPYNPNWGNRQYRVAPYQEYRFSDGQVTIGFGPSFPFEGGGWVRDWQLTVEDAAPVEEIISMREEKHGDFLSEDQPISTLEVNEKTVVVVHGGGLCEYVSMTVVGETANYTLGRTCGDTPETVDALLSIIRTMEFISE